MKILVKKTILFYIKKYPMAETQLLIWYNEFSKHEFNNFNEVKKVYGNASIVTNNRIVFNIKGNDFRLIISTNFLQNACYVIWFGTHKEYDKINVETISFDTTILTNKKI
jgi:mRNA interferase HigB